MADWKTLYERWAEVPEETRRKLRELFWRKYKEKPEKLKSFLEANPYAKKIVEKELPTLFMTIYPEKPKEIPLKPGEEIKVGPRFKPGDKVVYRWTGEELEVVSIAKWPYVLVKNRYGKLDSKDEKQLVTHEEYERLKAEEAARRGKKVPKKKPPRLVEAKARPREQVLKDIFYATLTRHRVPIKTGYRSMFRLELPGILELPTAEEQEKAVEDFAMEIVREYQAEKERRREVFRRPPTREKAPPTLPPGWKRVKGGYLNHMGRFIPETEAPWVVKPGVPAEERKPLLTGFARRRCPDPDHENPEWIKTHPEVEEMYPGGVFLANLEEERAAYCLPCPSYYRNRRFLKYCPYHRHKRFGVYLTTLGHWIEVYMWMYKVSGGRQGLDPGVVAGCGLDPKKYDKPVTWHPPGAVFEYWKEIGWAVPEKIQEVWEKEKREESEGISGGRSE